MPSFVELLVPAFSEIVLIASIIAMLTIHTVFNDSRINRPEITHVIAKFALLAALLLAVYYGSGLNNGFCFASNPSLRESTFAGIFIIDGFVRIAKIILLCIAFLFMYLSKKTIPHETIICFLFMVLGFMLAISANDFILLLLGLEISSIALALIMYHDHCIGRGICYNTFLIFCVGSSLLIFGSALLFYQFGSTDFSIIFKKAQKIQVAANLFVIYMPLVLIIFGVFAKMLFFPFHGVFRGISEAASWKIFMIFNLFSSFVGVVVIIRLFSVFYFLNGQYILLLSGLCGVIIGLLNIVNQNTLKGVFACNTIGNTGISIISFAAAGTNVVTSIFLFFIIQSVSLLIFCWIITSIHPYEKQIITMDNLSTITPSSPLLSFLLGFCTLCLIGIPPSPGFLPLFMLLENLALEGAFFSFTVIMLLKTISVWSGFKILNALLSTNIYDRKVRPVQRQSPAFFINMCALCIFLVIFSVKIDFFSQIITSAELTLRSFLM
jgi:NADH-quinone oxidoreductase subunit N